MKQPDLPFPLICPGAHPDKLLALSVQIVLLSATADIQLSGRCLAGLLTEAMQDHNLPACVDKVDKAKMQTLAAKPQLPKLAFKGS